MYLCWHLEFKVIWRCILKVVMGHRIGLVPETICESWPTKKTAMNTTRWLSHDDNYISVGRTCVAKGGVCCCGVLSFNVMSQIYKAYHSVVTYKIIKPHSWKLVFIKIVPTLKEPASFVCVDVQYPLVFSLNYVHYPTQWCRGGVAQWVSDS